MSSQIVSQTLQEHDELIRLIDKLIMTLKRFPNDVQWGDSQWLQDLEILDYIRIQTLSLQNAKKIVMQGYYRDSYHLIRMIFEGYFTLRLITTCDLYPLRVKVARGKSDPSLNDAKKRVSEEIKRKLGSRLVKIYEEDNKTLVAILHGVPIIDDTGKETGVVIPYYGAWRNFRPVEYHLRRETLQDKFPTLRFLTGEWAGVPRRKMIKKLNENYGLLYKYFLTFDRILENLCLNDVLNKKTATRVLVHYNFLSNFSHCTSDSIGLISRRRFTQVSSNGLENVYDHYFSELALLYTCHLLAMHLEHAIYYFIKWRRLGLKREHKVYRQICKETERQFGYFWFIFNKPHQYDKYSDANRKSNYRKKIFYRPEDVASSHVRYYDNPLTRLKRLHCSQRELITGNVYISPFHRDDALF